VICPLLTRLPTTHKELEAVHPTGGADSTRAELYSSINHHVKEGNGMPNFFITLSCAEYFWPDVLRLLNERLKIAGHANDVSTNFIIHYSALFFQSVKN
jgi:hypothetical protein